VEFRALSGAASEELERLRESGVVAGGVVLERTGQVRDPVLVRPVIGDALAGWMPDIERELAVAKGVVGISGTDMSEAAGLAADAAAWFGDRGRTVVLVDAIVERPVLGKALAEDRDEGLVDAVLFGVSREAIVRRTLAPGVSVIRTGSHPLSVDSVFEAAEFSKLLKGLAEDALVLVLVPPVDVPKALGTLDAVVCVAASEDDIASLASCTGGVRTTGILVREQSEAAGVEEPGEIEEVTPLVLPTREDATVSVETEQSAWESTTERPELGRQEAEAGSGDTGAAEHTPVVLGVSERRRRRVPNRMATAAALLVIVAIATLLWWFVDGERRFTSRPGGAGRMEQQRVVEGPESGLEEGRDAEVVEGPHSSPGEDQESIPVEASDFDGVEDTTVPPDETAESVTTDESDVPAALESPDGDTVITGPGGRYRIMVSSHRHEGAAVFEAGQLIERGVGAEVVATEVADRGIWFRVVVSGGYPMLSAAREVLDTVKTLGYEGAWIERAADNE